MDIRNFAIIAHVDSGKSTLADRFLEITGTVPKRDLVEQTLDSHPISRERGITIRLAPVTMNYRLESTDYCLNLIDTPGHVDFSYEVQRSLAACEGVILLVDATKGIQAQTLSHFNKAKALGLTIIPAINKIDLPNARIEEVEQELRGLLTTDYRLRPLDIFKVSAKTGQGVGSLLEAVITKLPAPEGNPKAPTRALIFSSQFDPHRGVIAFVRIVDGKLDSKEKIMFLATNLPSEALEVGHFTPTMVTSGSLFSGEVGYVITNLKDISRVRVGDTITTVDSLPAGEAGSLKAVVRPLPGYQPVKPMVFVSFFPADQNDFKELEEGLNKLKLNDAAISFSHTESRALGRGFRVGFLGHLHAEVSQERLERDFGLAVIATTPTVEYRELGDGETDSSSASESGPDTQSVEGSADEHLKGGRADRTQRYFEPWVKATIILPREYLGAVMTLCEDSRGVLKDTTYYSAQVTLEYELPLAEIITNFYDQLKSKTSGFGSLDYSFLEYRPFEAARLAVLINHQEIDALNQLVDKSKAQRIGSQLVKRLQEVIPRQQIPIPIQAAVDGEIIAREDIPAFRKDVTAKLYGGDRTRRIKLLEKQKEGKKKMKSLGQVVIPNDTFLKIFKT